MKQQKTKVYNHLTTTSKKYKLTNETIEFCGRKLHRIQALIDFSDVKSGDLGGWIEKENNLSQIGDAWVYGNAKVYKNASILHNAKVYDNAKVYGEAKV
nr:MAG TPA: Putative transferase, nesg, ydcK, Structural Genomics.38A [Bacteriophage sp.]